MRERGEGSCTCLPDPVSIDSWYPAHRPACPEENPVEYCPNCQSTYHRTPETEPKHLAPCTRCGSEGHAACQH